MPERNDHIIQNARVRWAVITGIFLLVTIFFTAQRISWRMTNGQPFVAGDLFVRELAYWVLWMPLLPIMLSTFRRYPIEPGASTWHFAPNLLLSLAAAPIHELLYRVAVTMLNGEMGIARALSAALGDAGNFAASLFTPLYKYWVIAGIYGGVRFYHRYREERHRADTLALDQSVLRAELREAQLLALRSQIQPHFLFNTLNTISFLMNRDTAKANRMLLRLSELLRMLLQDDQSVATTIEEELRFVRIYLDIQAIRFEDRLHVETEIDDGALRVRLPYMTLQPVVENAIKHGLEQTTAPLSILICVSRRANQVLLTVRDNGPGLHGSHQTSNGSGVGLENVRRKLDRLFGGAFSMRVADHPDGGVNVLIEIPGEDISP